jgi:hypothetical protein
MHSNTNLSPCIWSLVTAQDRLLFFNLDLSVSNTPTLLASSLDRYLRILADKCGTRNIEDLYVQMLPPVILAAKTVASKEDNPTWWQAMNGHYASTGKPLKLKLRLLRKSKLGPLYLAQMILPMFCPPGLSKLKDTQMGLSRSTRVVSVLVATNKFKVLTSLRPTAHHPSGASFRMHLGPLFEARRYHLCLSSCLTWER